MNILTIPLNALSRQTLRKMTSQQMLGDYFSILLIWAGLVIDLGQRNKISKLKLQVREKSKLHHTKICIAVEAMLQGKWIPLNAFIIADKN